MSDKTYPGVVHCSVAKMNEALSRSSAVLGKCPNTCSHAPSLTPTAFWWKAMRRASDKTCPYCGVRLQKTTIYTWDGAVQELVSRWKFNKLRRDAKQAREART